MSTLSEHLPKLSHAEFEKYPEPVEVHYKSGASYTGMVSNHLRCGQGVFKWPNGARYEGQYSENARNGKGIINKNIYQLLYNICVMVRPFSRAKPITHQIFHIRFIGNVQSLIPLSIYLLPYIKGCINPSSVYTVMLYVCRKDITQQHFSQITMLPSQEKQKIELNNYSCRTFFFNL